MKEHDKNFDICLFGIAYEYSSRTDVEVTIQYGTVILRKQNTVVELLGSLEASRIKELIIPGSINKLEVDVRRIWIPYSLFNNTELINDYLNAIFTPIIKSDNTAIISISPKVFNSMKKNDEVYLDEFFTVTNSKKFKQFKITINGYTFSFAIIVNDEEHMSKPVLIKVRDGKGNDDLW